MWGDSGLLTEISRATPDTQTRHDAACPTVSVTGGADGQGCCHYRAKPSQAPPESQGGAPSGARCVGRCLLPSLCICHVEVMFPTRAITGFLPLGCDRVPVLTDFPFKSL
jgi:hypothetical protein